MAGGKTAVVISGNGFTVICSDADLVESATDVAVTVAVCFAVFGGGGALYVADVPATDDSDPAPVSVQFTPRFVGSFVTVAVT